MTHKVMSRSSRPRIFAALLLPALGLSLAGNALAADRETRATSGRTQPQEAQAEGRNLRASKLIGMDVRNAQGENLGDIKDLIVDVGNDRAHYAVLSFGGTLGVGDKLFAYPVRMFSQTSDGEKLVLNVDKARLKAAPGFERDRDPDWTRYSEEVERFHGATVAMKPMPNAVLRRASELIGKDVDDRNGKDLGEIDDIIVNLRTGAIPYAVLEYDQAWNLNDKLVPIPLRAIDFSSERRDLVMNVDKTQLQTAKAFDERRWPDLNDPKYMAEVKQQLATMAPAGGGRAGRPETRQGFTGPGETETPERSGDPSSPDAGTSEPGSGASQQQEETGGRSDVPGY